MNEKNKEISYRYYVTDALHAIVGNTAGAQRVTLNATFREIWEGSADNKEEQTMSPEEIIEKMKEEFKKKGGVK